MRNKVLTILLILSFVAPIATTYFVLKFQAKQVKRAVKWKMIAGIDKAELFTLQFTEKQKKTILRWKHSREFEYQGEWYDIVDSSVNGDTTQYYLWWDHDETALNKQLSDLVSIAIGNNPQKQESQKRLVQFFKSLFPPSDNGDASFAFIALFNKYHFSQEQYVSVSLSPPAPPPKFL